MVYFVKTFFPRPPLLKERKIKGKRHYISPSGKALPSVTTVLGMLSEVGIDAWKRSIGEAEADKISKRSMMNGTELHTIIENYLDNKPPTSKNETSLKLFEQVRETLNENVQNIRAQEVQLFSDKIGLAGRVDCIAEYNGKLSVIDFKSARKKKQKSWIKGYFLQATAYAEMFKELTNQEIEQIVILISAEDGTVNAFVEEPKNWRDQLYDVVADYRIRNEIDDVQFI